VKLVQVVTTVAGELQVPEILRAEERYKIGERVALSVGTTDTVYEFVQTPKVLILHFYGADCYIDFNKDATDANSLLAPCGTFMTLAVEDVTKIVAKGVAELTLYVLTMV